MSAATPWCSGQPGASSQARIGALMPAARSSSASSRVHTPSQRAPAASAARATGSMPWPYPSALTTAMTWASVLAHPHLAADLPQRHPGGTVLGELTPGDGLDLRQVGQPALVAARQRR